MRISTIKTASILCLSLLMITSWSTQKSGAQKSSGKDEPIACAPEIGERAGCGLSTVYYNEETIFSQNDAGESRMYQFGDSITALNKEFENKQKDINQRTRALKSAYQDGANQNDMHEMARMMKEQSALDIDIKLLQQEYQSRFTTLRNEFMLMLKNLIEELAEEYEWDIVLPYNKHTAHVSKKADVTDTIIKRANERYRAEQRNKKFKDKN